MRVVGITKIDKDGWIPMAEQAVNLIYRLAEHPDLICADIIRKLAKELIQFNANNLPQGKCRVYTCIEIICINV